MTKVNNQNQYQEDKFEPHLPEGVIAIPIFWVTDNLARSFGRNQENRKISPKHVAKIKKGWKESQPYLPPITVNWETKNIIDGQHRLEAFLQLIDDGTLKGGVDADSDKILVRFINVAPEDEKKLIIDANTKSKNWSQTDYIESHAETKEDYKRLFEWCSNHTLCNEKGKIKPRYGAAIIKGKGCGTMLRSGKFVVTDEEWEEAEKTHEELVTILDILEKEPVGFIESLACAWGKCSNDTSFKSWQSMFKKEKNNINKMPYASKKDWLAIFDYVYSRIMRKLDKEGKMKVEEN